MKVKPLEVWLHNYVRNSMRAFLDGAKNLNWITGLICGSGATLTDAYVAFVRLGAWGDAERREQLINWFNHKLSAQQAAPCPPPNNSSLSE